MLHYICTGSCAGEATIEKVCEAQFCTRESQPLTPCNCEDGLHENAGKQTDSEDATE